MLQAPAPPTELTLLRGARQLITLHGPAGARRGAALQDLRIIEDGSVLIEDGTIVAVGSTRRLENLKKARRAIEIDVRGRVVMPGFVNPNLSASLENFSSSKKRLKRTSQVYDESLQLMRACLQHGTLTAEVKARAAEAHTNSDVPVLRQLTKIGDSPIEVIRTWKLRNNPASSEEIGDFNRRLELVSRRNLATFLELNAGDGQLPNPEFLRILRQSTLGINMAWSSNTQRSLEDAILSVRPLAIICPSAMHFAPTELWGQYPGIFVFSPAHETKQSIGRGLRHVIDAGGAVALSSGYDPAHASRFSMQTAISLTVLRGELLLEEAIAAATVNAAYAVGRGEQVGTLEVGKRADILVLSLPDYREIPRQGGINHVGMVLRKGILVFNRTRWKIGAHERATGRVHS